MCNFYDGYYPPDKLGYLFGAKLDIPEGFQGRYNTRPTNQAPVVRNNPDGERVLEALQFGMIPSWAKDKKHSYSMMNARDDKLLESKHWKPRFERQRCIVPATGFYEHFTLDEEQMIEGLDKPTNKVPFRLSLKSTEVFGFAGIWDSWTDKQTGEVIDSFSIVTTDPNETVSKIHNTKDRMALILPETAYDLWLSDIDKGKDLFDAGLFQPWPDEDIQYWQVNKQFDYGLNDDSLLEPVEQPASINGQEEQKNLF